MTSANEPEAPASWRAASTGAQRLYGIESEGESHELSSTAQALDDAGDLERQSFGQYLHEILSTVDFSGKDLEQIARTLARPYGHSEPEVAGAIDIVRRTLSLPPIAAVKRARRVFRAVPVAGNVPEGRMQATVDLLFETDKGWRLVEFRTDRAPGPDTLKKYAAQIGSCAETLAAVLQRPVASSVCMVRSGEILDPADL